MPSTGDKHILLNSQAFGRLDMDSSVSDETHQEFTVYSGTVILLYVIHPTESITSAHLLTDKHLARS